MATPTPGREGGLAPMNHKSPVFQEDGRFSFLFYPVGNNGGATPVAGAAPPLLYRSNYWNRPLTSTFASANAVAAST